MLNAASQPFFSLAKIATHDLLRLDTSEDDEQFLHHLGYALHKVPRFVAEPAVFDREDYWFSIALFARHLDRLSPELKAAFGRVMGLTATEFEDVLRKNPWTSC